MRNTFHLVLALLLGNLCLTSAQNRNANNGYGGVTVDLDGSLHCPMHAARTSFCAGDSNTTDFIVHCHNGVGKIGACSLDLVGVQPVGVKLGAACYEGSKTSGDAVCIYDGREFDTRPYDDEETTSAATTTRPARTEASGSEPTLAVVDDVAEYIMEGIRQHGSN